MSSGGDALVAYKHPTLGLVYARHKPAGGAWGSQVEVLSNNYQDTLRDLKTEFDGQGRAVVMARYRELNDAIRVNVRGAGSAGTWAHASAEWDETFLDDDGANPPNPSYDVRNLEALARHPEGVVAVWTRRNNETQVVVSRLRAAGWETPVAFAVPTSYYAPRVAVNDAGEILLAGTVDYSSVTEIRGMIVPSLTAPWPSPALLSPQASVANQYRDAFAVAGGSAFSVGWGVHGTGNQRTEVISTKAAGAACGAAPTPTATASASASPDPLATAVAGADRNPGPVAARRAGAPVRDRRLHDPSRGLQVRPRAQAHGQVQEAAEGLRRQDRHGQGEREEGRDGQGQEAQAAAVPAQAPEGDLHGHGVHLADKGQGTNGETTVHRVQIASSSGGWMRSSSRT